MLPSKRLVVTLTHTNFTRSFNGCECSMPVTCAQIPVILVTDTCSRCDLNPLTRGLMYNFPFFKSLPATLVPPHCDILFWYLRFFHCLPRVWVWKLSQTDKATQHFSAWQSQQQDGKRWRLCCLLSFAGASPSSRLKLRQPVPLGLTQSEHLLQLRQLCNHCRGRMRQQTTWSVFIGCRTRTRNPHHHGCCHGGHPNQS